MTSQIRVAVVGGGVAGCALIHGLLKYPHISVHGFEAKSAFAGPGAGIGLQPNGVKALRSMQPDVDKLFEAVGGILDNGPHVMVGLGEHKGATLLKLPGGTMLLNREAFLLEILKSIPEDRLHTSKKLDTIETNKDGSLTLRFADGSTYDADCVLGCDGIWSKTREAVLGPDHPAVAPIFAGFWDTRAAVPMEFALTKLGTHLIDPRNEAQTGLVANGCHMLFAPMSGDKFHLILAGPTQPGWDTKSSKTALDRPKFKELMSGIDEKFRDGYLDCLFMEGAGPGVIFNQWESQEAPSYHRGRILMLGDAAHACTPWMGQGASQSLEDVALIVALLAQVGKPGELEPAFRAFEKHRNGRPEDVIGKSRIVGEIICGMRGHDPKAVEAIGAENWFPTLWDIDMDQYVREAVELFGREKAQA